MAAASDLLLISPILRWCWIELFLDNSSAWHPPPDSESEVLPVSQVILNVQQSLGTIALNSTCTLD